MAKPGSPVLTPQRTAPRPRTASSVVVAWAASPTAAARIAPIASAANLPIDPLPMTTVVISWWW